MANPKVRRKGNKMGAKENKQHLYLITLGIILNVNTLNTQFKRLSDQLKKLPAMCCLWDTF